MEGVSRTGMIFSPANTLIISVTWLDDLFSAEWKMQSVYEMRSLPVTQNDFSIKVFSYTWILHLKNCQPFEYL